MIFQSLFYFYTMPEKILIEFLQKIHLLPTQTMQDFVQLWQPFTVKRKTILTVAGETERYLYFVLQGLQRAYYIGNENKEATIVFTYPPSFSGVADSFLTQTPSIYFLEAITPSSFLRIPYQALQHFMQEHIEVQQLLFKATSLTLKGVLQRQIELQCFSSEEKFTTLLRRSPHILHLVPHKYIASYLGINATNFSKLLASVKI